MRSRDPYHDVKVVHRARLIKADGVMSSLCYQVPRPINLRVAAWTNRDQAVTCPRCLVRIAERQARKAAV